MESKKEAANGLSPDCLRKGTAVRIRDGQIQIRYDCKSDLIITFTPDEWMNFTKETKSSELNFG